MANSFVARGNTYPVKDQLRSAGGKWNKNEKQWEFTSEPAPIRGVFFVPSPLPEGWRTTIGYKSGLESGRVVRRPLSRGDEPENFCVIVGQWEDKEFSSDSESWVPCTATLIRPLQAEEAEKLLGDLAARKNRQLALKTLKEHDGFEDAGPCVFSEIENGREKFEFDPDSVIHGGGWWVFVSQADAWVIINNGRDGDAWALNNCRTWGAGAIAFKTTDQAIIEKTKKLLAEIGATQAINCPAV